MKSAQHSQNFVAGVASAAAFTMSRAPSVATAHTEPNCMKWIKCEMCGKARQVRRWGRYCGNACRQRAKRERKKKPARA